MTSREREDRAIRHFCERLAAIEEWGVNAVERPDREKPGHGGCDAIIERGDRRFALEHTTIDSYSAQRADNHRFRTVVVPLEDAIRKAYPDSWIEICVPAGAVPTGTDWPRLAETLKEGCTEKIAQMPFGDQSYEFQLAGVPFPVLISRERRPQDPGCFVMRHAPGNLKAQLLDNIARAIRKKRDQLAPYRLQGLPTILLLDSDETALINRHFLTEAFVTAANRETVDGLDEVFIAETRRDPVWFYPVKLHSRIYPELPEFQWFCHQQYTLTYGDENF